MLSRYWGVVCVCLVLAGPVNGQEASEQHQSNAAASSERQESRAPFPIVIVQPEDQAARDTSREQQADKHDAADLLAQQQAASAGAVAANAANEQVPPVWAGAILSGIAAVVSVIALLYSIQVAGRADKTSRAELRPYIALIPKHCFNFDTGRPFHVAIEARNAGTTPAKYVRFAARLILIEFGPNGEAPIPSPETALGTWDSMVGLALAGGQAITHHRTNKANFTVAQMKSIIAGTAAPGILIKATYEDAFGDSHAEEVGYYLSASSDVLKKLTTNYPKEDLNTDFTRIPDYGEST
jgi:hypothetical protein